MSPGLAFVFGSQRDIRNEAAEKGWISKSTSLNTSYKTNSNTNITFRSTVEPIKQFRIELTANKTSSNNYSEFYKWDEDLNDFNSFSPVESGSYSISFISLKTAFSLDNDNNQSDIFNKFQNYRLIIAKQLANNNPNFNGSIDPLTGFPTEYVYSNVNDTIISTLVGGYGATSQEVMIPAFLSAYRGSNPDKSQLTAFPQIPLPNWRITYDGLIKFHISRKNLSNFSIAHAYRSTYTIGSYQNNINYISGNEINLNNMSYHVEKEISQVTINEQFSPLLKVDMTLEKQSVDQKLN